MIRIQKIVGLSVGLFCSVFFALSVQAGTASSGHELDRIAATVNDNVITESELNEAISRIKKQLAGNHAAAPAPDVVRKHVLDQLIERKLQLQLAEQAGISINDEEVNKVINNIAEQNKLSVKELYQKLTSEGMSIADYHQEIHEELTIQRVQQQEVGSHISITQQEINDLLRSAGWRAYNTREYHLEDILIALPEAPTPQDVADAKKQANDVLARLHRGMSFSEVAAAESSNSQALQGGDLGWLKLPQIPPAFATQLVHMKPSQILGPVATPNGFHIIRLVNTRAITEHVDPAEQRKQVEQLLYQRKLEEGLQTWLTRVRSGAFVHIV